MAVAISSETCKGTTKAGEPCSASGWKILATGYCHWHDPDRQLDEEGRAVVRHTRNVRSCDMCGGTLLKTAPTNTRYCKPLCAERARTLRRKARDTIRDAAKNEIKTAQQMAVRGSRARRGSAYDAFCETEWPAKIHDRDDETTMKVAATHLAVTVASVSRWMIAWREDRLDEIASEVWVMEASNLEMLGQARDDRPNPKTDPDGYQTFLDLNVRAFLAFLTEFFETHEETPWVITSFHIRWVRALLDAYFTGARQLILSPPRHGKTEFLGKLCIWLMIRRPNIRIVWIGPNGEIAKETVGAIMDTLENNTKLIRAFNAPGTQFKPAHSGRSSSEWASSGGRFKLATRTVTGMKSPTMVAFGRGGKVLSRDADLLVGDDLEDIDSTKYDHTRAYTQRWMITTFGSRKMKRTAVWIIGSRQHEDDWYNRAIDNKVWRVIVETAHNWTCDLNPDDIEAHVDCMLFPELNPYGWLVEQFTDAEALDGGRALAEMVYLNKTISSSLVQFNKPDIEMAYNRSRVLGDLRAIPGSIYHIAGFDPTGSAGFQSAFYWTYRWDENGALLLWVVDITNDKIGGIGGARDQIGEWATKYPLLKTWVVEKNLYDGEIIRDKELLKIAASHGLELIPHETHHNKRDRRYGPTAFAPMFTNGQIDIPYGDPASQKMADMWRDQLLKFNTVMQLGTQATKRMRVDTVMSGWFPLNTIRARLYEEVEVEVEYESMVDGYEMIDWGETMEWS